MREEVEARAAALIPPRTAAEARALAEAGPLVLELLPGPEGLTGDEALGVVHTAALVGAEESLPLLKRYRDHADRRVRARLVAAWEHFDTDEYADEVLSHVRPAGVTFRATTRAQALALHRFGPPSHVALSGAHTAAELLAFLDPDRVTHLSVLDNPRLRDLTPLTGLRRLTAFSIHGCAPVEDLGSMAGLRLTSLHLYRMGEQGPLHGLKQLTNLRALSLSHPLHGPNLTALLPENAPLESLSFQPGALGAAGLKGLGQWSALTYLMLGEGDHELTGEDFEEIAGHPALCRLLLESRVLHQFTHAPELPGITTLRLFELDGTEDLSALPRVFPALHSVIITPRQSRYFPADRCADLFPGVLVKVLGTFWNTSSA